MLFDTQSSGRMGSPSVAGSTRRLSSGTSSGSFSLNRLAPATVAANLPLRQRLRVEIVLAAIDRRAGEPGDPRDDRETAPAGGPHLARREQSPPALVELRADRLPAIPNGVLVDHATDLMFAAGWNPRHLSHTDARHGLRFSYCSECPKFAAGEVDLCREEDNHEAYTHGRRDGAGHRSVMAQEASRSRSASSARSAAPPQRRQLVGLDHIGRKMGGLPVEVIYEDDQQKPEVGQKTEKLIQSDKVDFATSATSGRTRRRPRSSPSSMRRPS